MLDACWFCSIFGKRLGLLTDVPALASGQDAHEMAEAQALLGSK